MIDLSNIGKYRENNRLEAKQAVGGFPRSLWETYSSFANTFGGIILLGVEETHDKELRIIGLSCAEERLDEFRRTVKDRHAVSVNILKEDQSYIADIEGRRIVVIEVPRADRHYRPVFIGSDPYSGTFRRSGDGDYHCSAEEVRSMFRDRGDVPDDGEPLCALPMSALCADTVRRFRSRMKNLHPSHELNTLGDDAFLEAVRAASRGGKTADKHGGRKTAELHPTIAGLLAFGCENFITAQFPNYYLEYREELGRKSGWSDRIVSDSGDWSGNLFDFYFKVYRRIVRGIRCSTVSSSGEWVHEPVHSALREALANAVLHANYYDRQGLVIRKCKTAVIISNPGCLRSGTVLSDTGHCGNADNACGADPRNATLTEIFALAGIGERTGAGLPFIKAVWQQQGWIAPKLEESFGPDRVTISLPLSFSAEHGEYGASPHTQALRAEKTAERRTGICSAARRFFSRSVRRTHETEQRQIILDYLLANVSADIFTLSREISRGILYTSAVLKKLEKENSVVRLQKRGFFGVYQLKN
ncbi:MAG: putative DNA binding domain-containing protein [Bacteroides sp.]|nr:putative DNA binding domain-containing protein [Prevotella sp.]MCM1407171.1 putative DNA binding domain-containing protein [Treponema brennaborense]MCM1470323.1 putative DNA binding domain-containing protein [Bacteroides sp.]